MKDTEKRMLEDFKLDSEARRAAIDLSIGRLKLSDLVDFAIFLAHQVFHLIDDDAIKAPIEMIKSGKINRDLDDFDDAIISAAVACRKLPHGKEKPAFVAARAAQIIDDIWRFARLLEAREEIAVLSYRAIDAVEESLKENNAIMDIARFVEVAAKSEREQISTIKYIVEKDRRSPA